MNTSCEAQETQVGYLVPCARPIAHTRPGFGDVNRLHTRMQAPTVDFFLENQGLAFGRKTIARSRYWHATRWASNGRHMNKGVSWGSYADAFQSFGVPWIIIHSAFVVPLLTHANI